MSCARLALWLVKYFCIYKSPGSSLYPAFISRRVFHHPLNTPLLRLQASTSHLCQSFTQERQRELELALSKTSSHGKSPPSGSNSPLFSTAVEADSTDAEQLAGDGQDETPGLLSGVEGVAEVSRFFSDEESMEDYRAKAATMPCMTAEDLWAERACCTSCARFCSDVMTLV